MFFSGRESQTTSTTFKNDTSLDRSIFYRYIGVTQIQIEKKYQGSECDYNGCPERHWRYLPVNVSLFRLFGLGKVSCFNSENMKFLDSLKEICM